MNRHTGFSFPRKRHGLRFLHLLRVFFPLGLCFLSFHPPERAPSATKLTRGLSRSSLQPNSRSSFLVFFCISLPVFSRSRPFPSRERKRVYEPPDFDPVHFFVLFFLFAVFRFVPLVSFVFTGHGLATPIYSVNHSSCSLKDSFFAQLPSSPSKFSWTASNFRSILDLPPHSP